MRRSGGRPIRTFHRYPTRSPELQSARRYLAEFCRCRSDRRRELSNSRPLPCLDFSFDLSTHNTLPVFVKFADLREDVAQVDDSKYKGAKRLVLFVPAPGASWAEPWCAWCLCGSNALPDHQVTKNTKKRHQVTEKVLEEDLFDKCLNDRATEPSGLPVSEPERT